MELNGVLLDVNDPTDVAEARRRALTVASQLGFDETVSGQAAIAVSEAATNLLKHATRGQMFVGINRGNPAGLQIVAMDRGPGIRDVTASMLDGISTAGTSGNGLGAIRRLARALKNKEKTHMVRIGIVGVGFMGRNHKP